MDVTTKITKAAVNTHMTKVGTAIVTKLVLMLMPVVGGKRVSEEKKKRKHISKPAKLYVSFKNSTQPQEIYKT